MGVSCTSRLFSRLRQVSLARRGTSGHSLLRPLSCSGSVSSTRFLAYSLRGWLWISFQVLFSVSLLLLPPMTSLSHSNVTFQMSGFPKCAKPVTCTEFLKCVKLEKDLPRSRPLPLRLGWSAYHSERQTVFQLVYILSLYSI